MYTVCTRTLDVLESFEFLSEAKYVANGFKSYNPELVYFVCSPQGLVIAGY